jgi:hypothetical protein
MTPETQLLLTTATIIRDTLKSSGYPGEAEALANLEAALTPVLANEELEIKSDGSVGAKEAQRATRTPRKN